MSAIFVYITCEDPKEARRIAEVLLEKKLIACANVFAPHQAIYHWQGKIQSDTETAMIVKTRHDLFDEVCSAVKNHHSYDVPCILALPVTNGEKSFLDFISQETSPR